MSRNKRQAREQKRLEEEARRKTTARTRLYRNLGIGAAAAVIGVLFILSFGGEGTPQEGDITAEAWDLPALEGEGRVALADFTGKPTVAVFFASWCEFCEEEVPGFAELSDRLGDQVNWVGINSQDNGGGLREARSWGIADRWPLAEDIDGRNGSGLSTVTFGARGMPLTVVYDEAGTVVHVQRGAIDAAGLLQILQANFDVA